MDCCLMGAEFLFGKVKTFWRTNVVIIAEQCECTYCHCTVHLILVKTVNFMLCILSTTEKRKKRGLGGSVG